MARKSPLPESSLPSDAEVLDRLISSRRSCRGFRPDSLPRATIEAILRIAQGAASWCNSQPWQVIVTSGNATDRFREALYAHASTLDWRDPEAGATAPDFAFPARYTGIYKERQRETGWMLYESVGVAYGDRAASARQMLENFRLFGAPHVMILTTEADLGVYGAIDCGLYVGNLMLAAQSLGVGTIAQAALASVSPFVRQWFDIPENRRIVCGISFGYADTGHPANAFRTTRASLDQVVSFVE